MTPMPPLEEHWDLVVIGAGPAGSAAAWRAATLGCRVLLVDRATFPRPKVCGGCLSPAGMTALRAMGLDRDVARAGTPLYRLEVRARGRCATISLGAGGVAISREALDTMLVDAAAAAGARVLQGASASLLHSDHLGARIGLRIGTEDARIATRAAIAADGLAGTFLPRDAPWESHVGRFSRVGLGARLAGRDALPSGPAEPGVVAMYCGKGGYVGMVRLADGSIDVGAAVSPTLIKDAGGPAAAVRRIMHDAGGDGQVFDDAIRWRGTAKLTRRRTVERGAVFVAGDAAGYVEPFTGEGIWWAARGGTAAAEHAHAWIAGTARPGDWSRQHHALFRARHRSCATLALGLRSPRLIAGAASVLHGLPALSPIVRGLFAKPWGSHAAAPGVA